MAKEQTTESSSERPGTTRAGHAEEVSRPHPFDLIPAEGHAITADQWLAMCRPKASMTRECAISILAAELRWGKGTIRPELLEEAKEAMK